MKKKIDILYLDWPNSERDLNISIPVLVYLRKKYGYKIIAKNIYNGLYYLNKYKPKVLFLSNAIGAEINFLVAKYASLSGIKVVTLTSEGNFVEGQMNIFLWGWNKEKKFYHHQQNVWTKRALEIAIKEYPRFKEIAVIGGATGFDKYKLFKHLSKEKFLKQNNLTQYSKVVGITSFGFFEHIQNAEYVKKHNVVERFGKEQFQMYLKDLDSLREIYKKLVLENRNTLFVIRTHPITKDIKNTEFSTIYHLDNVFVSNTSNKQQSTNNNHLSVMDCISISDIWIAYESTTLIEAWILDKITAVINPSRYDFIREINYKGALKRNSFETLDALVKKIINNTDIKEYKDLSNIRKEIIANTIGYADGNNHKRTGENIHDFIQKIENQKIDTSVIPLKLKIEHRKNYIKQKSKLYQLYNPNVHEVYKQNDTKKFNLMFNKYDVVITP